MWPRPTLSNTREVELRLEAEQCLENYFWKFLFNSTFKDHFSVILLSLILFSSKSKHNPPYNPLYNLPQLQIPAVMVTLIFSSQLVIPTFLLPHPAGHDRFTVLPPPEDLGGGVATGLAGQVHSLLLSHHEVVGAEAVHDAGWDYRIGQTVLWSEE